MGSLPDAQLLADVDTIGDPWQTERIVYPDMRVVSIALASLGVLMSISACGNSDLTVTSDLGEKAIIKESAVTRLPFDSKKARDEASAFMSSAVNKTNECASRTGLTQSDCWSIYGSGYETSKARLQAIDAFDKSGAKIWTVKYRRIMVDLNGNKEADRQYSEVNCIPESMKPELVATAKRVAEVASLPTPDDSKPGSVARGVDTAICERYGK